MYSITSLKDFDKMNKKDCLLIKKIVLGKQKIDELPDKFFWCTNVEHIHMKAVNIILFPTKFALFNNLKILYLNNNYDAIIHENHMMCLMYRNDVIPTNITHLHIIWTNYTITVINNIPNNIKYLSFGWADVPLKNLPPGLEEIKIINSSINKNMYQIPYGCNIIMKNITICNFEDIYCFDNKDEIITIKFKCDDKINNFTPTPEIIKEFEKYCNVKTLYFDCKTVDNINFNNYNEYYCRS